MCRTTVLNQNKWEQCAFQWDINPSCSGRKYPSKKFINGISLLVIHHLLLLKMKISSSRQNFCCTITVRERLCCRFRKQKFKSKLLLAVGSSECTAKLSLANPVFRSGYREECRRKQNFWWDSFEGCNSIYLIFRNV